MTEFMAIDIALLLLVMLTGIAVVEMRRLFSAVLLMGIYSLLMALVWINMDSMDVAFTEAAVGAGISTILLVGTLVLVGENEIVRKAVHWPALLAVVLTAAVLVYGTLDMPAFAAPDSPASSSPVARAYIDQTVEKDPSGKSGVEAAQRAAAEKTAEKSAEKAPPEGDYFHGYVANKVTAVIVAYRAFDTMFEVAVIFTAGLSMMLLLRGRKGNPRKGGLL